MRLAAVLVAIVVAVAVLVAATGGGNDGDETPTATPAATETPSGDGTSPPSASLPPQFIDCMARQGFDVRSPDEIHTVPQPALQACLGALHSGGGTP